MAGHKRFGTSLLGFNKTDVNSYIEKILKEFNDKLKEKEDEISLLKNENNDLKSRYQEVSTKVIQIGEDRTKISDVLIRAQEKAELIIEEANQKAFEEKRKTDALLEIEREKIVDAKSKLRKLKKEASRTLKSFESEIRVIISDDETYSVETQKLREYDVESDEDIELDDEIKDNKGVI